LQQIQFSTDKLAAKVSTTSNSSLDRFKSIVIGCVANLTEPSMLVDAKK